MKYELRLLIIIVLLLFIPKIFFGQLIISGRIIERTAKNPIPFANIWIKDVNIGITSNENGFFSLKTDSIYINKSILISSIGYKDTLIQIDKLESEIELIPKIYELSEIIIIPKKRNELIINDLSDAEFPGGIMNDTTPQIVGRYFPYEKKNANYKYIKSVIIYSRDSRKGKLNLRLCSFDTTNVLPIKELVHENIIIETKSSLFYREKPVEIDLSEFNLILPENGILVGIEWLIIPENRYKVTFNSSNKKITKTMYAPSLCATIDKQGCVYKYIKGTWLKPRKNKIKSDYKWANHYFNPAISLVLMD